MKKGSLLTALSISLIIFLFSCKKENEGSSSLDCATVTNKAFAADINPIIQSSCAGGGCHATGSSNGPGALTNYTQVFNARAAVRSSVSSGSMPKGSSLSASQKNSILCWIDSGAPNN
jgi:hypothetical protein